jgi:type III pantothenate kinase
MLLAIDAGNSAVKLGLFRGSELLKTWRVDRDELSSGLDLAGLDPKNVEAVIISSVVPELNHTLRSLAQQYFNLTPLFVDHTTNTGLKIRYDDPSQLGSDRIVSAVAAVEKYRPPCVVVDFGTATTFNAVNSKREYLGGIIAPGVMTSAEALFARAAKLPRVAIQRPKKVIGTSTVEAMQSGIFYGYGNLVDGLLEQMLQEMQETPKVIATGGLAQVIGDALHFVYEFDQDLTLDGLRIIYDLNKA